MKRVLLAIALAMAPLALVGCKTVTAPPQPLAPGYNNPADQQMAEILAGARGFYSTIQCETQGMNWSKETSQCVADPSITTPMVLSVTEKATFNKFGVTLNAANQVYLAYHAGTATQAAAQAAVDNVKQQQAALPIPGGK